jgi:hypothetical protein
LHYAPEALLSDYDFAVAAMKIGAAGEAYECFADSIQQNRHSIQQNRQVA